MKSTFVVLDEEQAEAYRDNRLSMLVVPLKDQPGRYCDVSSVEDRWYFDAPGDLPDTVCGSESSVVKCPFGKPDDEIVLGSSWAVPKQYDDLNPKDISDYEVTSLGCDMVPLWSSLVDSKEDLVRFGRLRLALHMPKFIKDRMPRETIESVECRQVKTIHEREINRCGEFMEPYVIGKTWHAEFRYWFNKKYERKNVSYDDNPWCWFIKFQKKC